MNQTSKSADLQQYKNTDVHVLIVSSTFLASKNNRTSPMRQSRLKKRPRLRTALPDNISFKTQCLPLPAKTQRLRILLLTRTTLSNYPVDFSLSSPTGSSNRQLNSHNSRCLSSMFKEPTRLDMGHLSLSGASHNKTSHKARNRVSLITKTIKLSPTTATINLPRCHTIRMGPSLSSARHSKEPPTNRHIKDSSTRHTRVYFQGTPVTKESGPIQLMCQQNKRLQFSLLSNRLISMDSFKVPIELVRRRRTGPHDHPRIHQLKP